MIELNLLPGELRQKKKEIRLPSIPVIPVAGGVLSLLILMHILLFGVLQVAKGRVKSYNKKWEELAPKRKEVLNLKAETETMDRKVHLLEALIKNRILWAEKLNAISDSLPSNIWLTELSYAKAPAQRIQDRIPGIIPQVSVQAGPDLGALHLRGFATGKTEEATSSVGRYIKALEENSYFGEDFSDIELGSVKRSVYATDEVMEFNLICSYKEEKESNKEGKKEGE